MTRWSRLATLVVLAAAVLVAAPKLGNPTLTRMVAPVSDFFAPAVKAYGSCDQWGPYPIDDCSCVYDVCMESGGDPQIEWSQGPIGNFPYDFYDWWCFDWNTGDLWDAGGCVYF